MKLKANEVGISHAEKPKRTNPFKLLVPLFKSISKRINPSEPLVLLLFGLTGCGGKHPIYRVELPPGNSAEYKGGTEYNDRYVPNASGTGSTSEPVPFEKHTFSRPTLDTMRVDTSTKLGRGITIIGREGRNYVVVAPSSRYLTVLFEGLGKPPLTRVERIVDRGNVIEMYDEKGLYLRVSGLPGDTVVIEKRGIAQRVIDGREFYSYEMIEIYREKGSFYLDTSKAKDLQFTLRVSKSEFKPIPEGSSGVIKKGVVAPSSAFIPYSAFGSPSSVTPQDLAAIAVLFNIQNPEQWHQLIRTLRAVNGGSLDPADLREFFVGLYSNSIRAIREIDFVPNATANLDAAVSFGLVVPWLYGNIGGKGETSVIGTSFVSRGTPYVGLALQVPWHLGVLEGTNALGARLNAYKFEKGYVLDWADTTTLVFENRGWSLDLAYLLSMNNFVGLSVGVNDVLYSIYGTRVIYDPSLKEIGSENDIYIRPPTTMVTGLGIGGLYSPVVIGLDAKWGIANRSVAFSGIDGAIALAYTLHGVPFVVGMQGGYPVRDGDKWISLFLSFGPGGQITGGGSLGGGLRNAGITDHRYGFGLYGRRD